MEVLRVSNKRMKFIARASDLVCIYTSYTGWPIKEETDELSLKRIQIYLP